MCHNNQFHFRIDLKGFLQRCRIHVPGIIFRIDKYRYTTFIYHGIDSSVKGHIRAEHPVLTQGTPAGFGSAIEPFPRQFHRKVQGGSTG